MSEDRKNTGFHRRITFEFPVEACIPEVLFEGAPLLERKTIDRIEKALEMAIRFYYRDAKLNQGKFSECYKVPAVMPGEKHLSKKDKENLRTRLHEKAAAKVKETNQRPVNSNTNKIT